MEKKLPTRTDCVFLTCHTKKDALTKKIPFIIMAPIDDELEARLDAGLAVTIKTENYNYLVTPSKVLTYGDIDLNNDEDIDLIYRLNLNINAFSGCTLPSEYFYDEHSCLVHRSGIRFFQTWDNLQIFRFKHGELCKPKKIIIFKHG